MKQTVSVDLLQPGVFISIDEVRWLDHPFLLNRFRLSSEEQIKVLRSLGLKTVAWDPAHSTAQPLPEKNSHEGEEVDFSSAVLHSMLDAKRERTERSAPAARRPGPLRTLVRAGSERHRRNSARSRRARPNESCGRAKSTVEAVWSITCSMPKAWPCIWST